MVSMDFLHDAIIAAPAPVDFAIPSMDVVEPIPTTSPIHDLVSELSALLPAPLSAAEQPFDVAPPEPTPTIPTSFAFDSAAFPASTPLLAPVTVSGEEPIPTCDFDIAAAALLMLGNGSQIQNDRALGTAAVPSVAPRASTPTGGNNSFTVDAITIFLPPSSFRSTLAPYPENAVVISQPVPVLEAPITLDISDAIPTTTSGKATADKESSDADSDTASSAWFDDEDKINEFAIELEELLTERLDDVAFAKMRHDREELENSEFILSIVKSSKLILR
jgi:hypothetical protein